MKEYIFGMDCLQLLLDDGGHTMTLVDIMAAEYFEEEEENDNDDFDDFDDDDDDDSDDDNDKVGRHNLNIGVLTTDIAFSCGNLFPSLMKDMGFPIIGEKSGGGIEPDFVIDLSDNDGMQDYSALYDFATIGGYISSATQICQNRKTARSLMMGNGRLPFLLVAARRQEDARRSGEEAQGALLTSAERGRSPWLRRRIIQ